MQLSLPNDSVPVKEMFERFFATESTSERVRAAEPIGFDPALWRELIALDLPFMRVSENAGGSGMSLFDACLMMEQAGRRLASAPLAEAVVALRILGELGGDVASQWMERVRDGESVLTIALHPTVAGKPQMVSGGAVAKGILSFNGSEIAIEVPSQALDAPATLGGSAIGLFVPGQGERLIIASGDQAQKIWAAGIEEWKILTAAALVGLSREALTLASEYACERVAFGQPIGSYQGISHPLAIDVIDADGGALLLWWTLDAIAKGDKNAAANISVLFWWASRTARNAVAHAIQTFGGYGLSNEYDIQLYHRRAKSWAQVYGDPTAELTRGGRRLLLGESAELPDAGLVEVNFEVPTYEHPLADETRAILAAHLDPDREDFGEQNFEAHNWDVHKALGKAGLLYPDWPAKWGGRDGDTNAGRACRDAWQEAGYAGLAQGVTGMAGKLVQLFGQPELQEEVLPAFASGEATSCLGFTEPSGGSDVFAAKTRAVRDGDHWVINGQKMFTSGAELASYVLLLTRTDPDVAKHKGLTLFLVPLDHPGIEIQPIHTFMDELTNATFYADVRIPDRYRLGEVNSGVKTMSTALSMEQGGSYYHFQMRDMLDAVADWARTEERDGAALINHPDTLSRLARVFTQANISESLTARAQWTQVAGETDFAYGPASKVFSTQAFIDNSADLLDLAAPASMIRSHKGLGVVEKGYRHSSATSVYGGTSEVLRSMVAERRLGLPRSRS